MARESRRITLGGDPEFVLKDVKTGKIVPAYNLLGGEKDNPIKFKYHDFSLVGGYLEDGAMAELNFGPFEDPDTFHKMYLHAVAKFRIILSAKGLDIFTEDDRKNTISLTKSQLREPKALIMGCAPDRDAYDLKERPPQSIEEMGSRRYAGGHIHVGITPWPEKVPKHIFIQFLDLFIFNAFYRSHDPQNGREAFYGKPGIYREKPYGVEYRSFSNNIYTKQSRLSSIAANIYGLANLFSNFELYGDLLSDFYGQVDWAAVRKICQSKELTLEQTGHLLKIGRIWRNLDGNRFYHFDGNLQPDLY